MKKLVVAVFSLCVVFGFGSLQPIGAGEESSVRDLFESKCSLCHPTDRPKSKRKTREEWEVTVMRMKNVNGARVSDEEAQAIIDYLAQNWGK